jgi:hypothetical protein
MSVRKIENLWFMGNTLKQIADILEGHTNEFLGYNEELANERL